MPESSFTGPHARQRRRMTIDHLWGRGVRDRRVLEAMLRVPREEFISPEAASDAYEDGPIGIGQGQTISQPYMVAKMTELAEVGPDSHVLELGGGSGYQTAVLLELGARVWSIEIIAELARAAEARLRRLGTTRFEVLNRDGYGGLPEHAPYDAIIMAAAPREIPPALFDQLAQAGITRAQSNHVLARFRYDVCLQDRMTSIPFV